MLVAVLAYVKDIAHAQEWFEDESTDAETNSMDSDSNSSSDAGSRPAGVQKVSIKGFFLDHDIVKISIFAANMQTPVLGLAFHLNYDSETLAFLRYDPGDFLEKGGDPFYLVSTAATTTANATTGELIFGETLRRDDSFPIGNGEIASFYFQELDFSQEKYSFEFENGVVSTLDTVRQDIDNVQFENAILDKNSPPDASGNDLTSSAKTNLEANVSASGDPHFWLYLSLVTGFTSLAVIILIIKLRTKCRQSKICTFRSRGIESPQA